MVGLELVSESAAPSPNWDGGAHASAPFRTVSLFMLQALVTMSGRTELPFYTIYSWSTIYDTHTYTAEYLCVSLCRVSPFVLFLLVVMSCAAVHDLYISCAG